MLDPPADAELAPEEYWLFLHLIVERLSHYRFLFQDLSIVPLIIAFLYLQRYWQTGLATGGVKA